jgi:hypothetical protein
MRYAAIRDPGKRFDRPVLGSPTLEQAAAILDAPDQRT